jgi:hypothetical protein
MDQELIQILEMLAAVVMAVIAYWQNRQKAVAVDAKDEALVERDLAEARQWETEALKDNVISFFDPEDESVVKAPARGGGQVLEDDLRDKEVGRLRALARGPDIAAEADRGCRRAEEDPVSDLGTRVLLRDRVRVTEGRWKRGGEWFVQPILY